MLDLISVLIAVAAAVFFTSGFFRREAKRGVRRNQAEDARTLKRLDDLQKEAKKNKRD